jgi:hypothetical protein
VSSYPWLVEGPDEPFPTELLDADLLPPKLADVDDHRVLDLLNRFAHTFDGYEHAGSLEELARRAESARLAWEGGAELTADAGELRAYLFFWFRADRHGGGYGPNGRDVTWLNALIDGLTSSLSAP